MSVCEGSASRLAVSENTDTVHVNTASVSDAETIQNSNSDVTNVRNVEEETPNDNELLKGLLTDTFCQVCEAVLLFESQRISHYQGKKHAQRVQIYLRSKKAERSKQNKEHGSIQGCSAGPEKFCELCNMVFSSPVVARSHYEGKVHAKNLRKSNATLSVDSKAMAHPVVHPVTVIEATTQCKVNQEQKESSDPTSQEVDLNDPNKYCKLCTASFNNPLMAQQHYSGRKHQRKQAQQEMLNSLGETSEHVNSLTCPLCCVTFGSVDVYQTHMQGKKHHMKERKIVDLCKKKEFDSFQDELADYIQVQRARGLEPKTKQSSEIQGQEQNVEDEQEDEGAEFDEKLQFPANMSDLPRPAFYSQHRRPPFNPQPIHAAGRGRFHQGCTPYPPPLIPGLTGRALRKRRLLETYSSSSSSHSDSSSSSYSSSSSGSSEGSRDESRLRRKRKEGTKRRRKQGNVPDESVEKTRRKRSKDRRTREDAKKARRQRDSSSENEQEKTQKEKKHSRGRHKKGHGKRLKENQLSVDGGLNVGNDKVQTVEQQTLERTEHIEEKSKQKKEKKKQERGDNRTEEEKLWDETILGIF
ncbi:zinc finger matrin-type protein 1 isoform X2 [Trichomycterus rosablanca]|uniref:zinc finger matrin-type protein 1 isoform X2 n=1 Tax=Trichomycterus rosablanca TaxID=2290929 RepID=UPI002F358BBB